MSTITFKKTGQYGSGKDKTTLMTANNGWQNINFAYETRIDKIGTLYILETPIGRYEMYGMKKVKQFISGLFE